MVKLLLLAVAAILIIVSPAILILCLPILGEFKPLIPTFTASMTLLLGWLFTSYQNWMNFFRSETIKHKDKLLTLVEDFFDDFIEKLEERSFNEQERISFIKDRISSLEFKHSIQQKIYGKKAIIFLSNETFAKLRMLWKIDETDHKKHKRQLQDLKEDVLQEIENNYILWLKSK